MITDAEFVAIRAFDKSLFTSVDQAQRIINEKNGQLINLVKMVEDLQAALLAERAGNAARDAQIVAFVETHPDSALLVKTGKVYPSGRKQTKASVIFDDAFDKKARALGSKDPAKLRAVAK